ncbi:MAG: hypothetical protein QGG67_10270 [Gammaproteobacteria bacterium]|jgi:hypothetical protein|nr:hypothetical protein [Gammaproteobacteria bacterium]MDP6096353.1 hypothetical protein [Gammaproteobacteria bacterium]|tara:strand:+ start:52 stop:552 length:501 start_codon:yes stop_codon:yes gene_type:complete
MIRTYDKSSDLYKGLERAYWLVKEEKVEEAEALIKPVAEFDSWARFDQVFEIISDWPEKQIALNVCSRYLPLLFTRQDYMTALKLCRWCLKHDWHFLANDGKQLIQLASEAGSPDQHKIVALLIENYAKENPGMAQARQLLMLAADICQSKLNSQVRYAEIMGKIN